jgi:ribosome biogenesis GTPase
MKKKHDEENNPQLPNRWTNCPIEEEFFGDRRKEQKAARKQASSKDRSKYKKTDRLQYEKRLAQQQHKDDDREDLKRGRVLSIISRGIIVDCEDRQYICVLRGTLKKEKGQFKNLVTVGDFVLFRPSGADEGSINSVEPRKTVLSRADNLSQRKEQLIAANIDQVLITVSIVSPPLKPFLVDRYIIATQKGGMTPLIVVNKIDLLDQASEKERTLYEEFIEAYRTADIAVLSVSTTTGEGIEELKAVMRDKASVFSGQSGVGKSSLINSVTGLDLRIGKTVDKTNKGAHTTTSAQLIPLQSGGWCIDTPGIKSFGIWNLKREEIESHFPEIYQAGKQCKFPNCSHIHEEEECAVQQAVNAGQISPLRYESYGYLIGSIDQTHLRR